MRREDESEYIDTREDGHIIANRETKWAGTGGEGNRESNMANRESEGREIAGEK